MFKKIKIIMPIIALSGSVAVFASSKAEEEFEKAWKNTAYTQIQLEDVDINRVLKEHYRTSKPVNFTSTMLWDMEVKKAWDPKSYIPYVVREGKSWGKKRLENGDDMFARSSEQKQWLKQDIYEDVF